jgi:hypothetical protein
MGLSTASYRRSLLSVDSVDLPSSQCICFAFNVDLRSVSLLIERSWWVHEFISFRSSCVETMIISLYALIRAGYLGCYCG